MPSEHDLALPRAAGLLEHVRAHHEVGVPVAAGVRAVRADAADLGCEVEDELRPGVGEEPLGVGLTRQVVVAAPGDERLDPVRLQPLDEMRAEEAASAGDEHAHAGKRRRRAPVR